MSKVEFNKDRINTFIKFTSEYFESVDLELGSCDNGFVANLITLKLNGYILSNQKQERVLTYYCPRPTFFDWLFRRQKKVKFELLVKDILLNPPKLKYGTTRLYIPKQIKS